MQDFNFDVFLSHNKADKAMVEMLGYRLEKSGLKVWLDHWNLLPGDPWQDEIEEALDRSHTVAVFVGPSGIGGWHNEEMRSALETRVVDRNRRVIPVLLPGAVEPDKGGLPRFLRRLHWVDFRNGLEDEATFNLFVAGITGRPLKRSEPSSATPALPPRIRTYREFDLRLARTGDDKLEVEIISPHSGDGRGIAPIPVYTTASIESGQGASLQQIGEEIGQALFPEEVRRRFETSLHDATKAGEDLRVRLRFHDKGLANIPWEAARLDEDYLALRPATPLVRYVPASEPPRKLSIRGPVHVLGIMSSPLDQAPLAVDEEKACLEQALEPLIKSGRLRLTWLEKATTPALQEALRRNAHVVHYIGHGDYDAENQEGELLFEDESSATSSVKASWLATLLRDSGVCLAFLNACKTGHAAGGVAEVLVRREVPAALGMQVSVRDDVATAFSETFYAALVDGWPVDAAVVEGRKAIVNVLNNNPDQPDWIHPVLYMRAPDGVLFG